MLTKLNRAFSTFLFEKLWAGCTRLKWPVLCWFLTVNLAVGQIKSPQNYIRVDQFGYLPKSKKVAVIAKAVNGFNSGIGIDLDESKEVELIDAASGTLAFKAKVVKWLNGSTDVYSGDKGWWFDFSSVEKVGEYFVRVKNTKNENIESYRFVISDEVYAEALRAAVNMYYYQRTNIEKLPQYASGNKWIDKAWYSGKNQDTEALYLKDFSKVKNLSKGWIDAGDPNKYVTFAVDVVHDLLTSYEQNMPMWDKFNLKIPESNNNIPDFLDEIKWEIDWVKNMQDSISGGIHNKVGILNDSRYISPPSTDNRTRYYGPICPSATITGAGMMAHAAYHFKKFPELKSYSEELSRRAELAWEFFKKAPQKDLRCDDGEIEAGDADGPGDHYATEYLAEASTAAVYLFALTGKAEYHSYFKTYYNTTRPWKSDDWGVYRSGQSSSVLFYLTLPDGDPAVRNDIISKKTSAQKSKGSYYELLEADNLYRSKAHIANWGSNSLLSRQANDNLDFLNYKLLNPDHPRFLERAEGILHYFHGVNPFGLCHISNMYMYGADYCFDEMWHTWFASDTPYDNTIDGNPGPAPGFIAGGFNKSTVTQMKVKIGKDVFDSKISEQPIQKTFSTDNAGKVENAPWAYNEPAIYYNSGYVKLLANFVNKNAEKVGVQNITVFPVNDTLEIDEEIQASVIFSPSIASNQNLKFSSSNTAVATVTSTGYIKGLTAGTAVISITTEDKSITKTINIKVNPLAALQKCGLVENFGFETNLSKWTILNNATRSSFVFNTGKKSAQIFQEGGMRYAENIPLKPNDQINIDLFAKVEGGPNSANFYLDFFDASGKELLRSTIEIFNSTFTKYSKKITAPAKTAYAQIWAYLTGANGSLFIDDVCLNVVSLLSTEPASEELRVKILPNPNYGHFKLEWEDAEAKTFSIYNSNGKKLLTKTLIKSAAYLDLAYLGPGVYLLEDQNKKRNQVQKIIIQ
jgi:endoglucanase